MLCSGPVVSALQWSSVECYAVVQWLVLCGGPVVSVERWSSGECSACGVRWSSGERCAVVQW